MPRVPLVNNNFFGSNFREIVFIDFVLFPCRYFSNSDSTFILRSTKFAFLARIAAIMVCILRFHSECTVLVCSFSIRISLLAFTIALGELPEWQRFVEGTRNS